MKMTAVTARRVLVYCGLCVALHWALLIVMERTGAIEKLMAGPFSTGDFLLIAGFILVRLATYMVVPAVVVGLIACRLAAWLTARRRPIG